VNIEDKDILEEIIEKLNVEKIVFCPDKNISVGSLIVIYLVWGINMALNPSRNLILMLIGVVMIIACIITFLYYIYYRRALINYRRVLIYDKKNNIIKIIAMSNKVKEFIPGSETYKLTEHKTVPAICNFKIKKYNHVVMHTNILLPKYYREDLKELYKISNN
ncbi:MAG: hypothetical protein ACRDA5_06720, partial [Clostridium sp.]